MRRTDLIKSVSSSPLTILDIGARGGIQKRWADFIEWYPATVYGFDPDPEHCRRLNAEAGADVRYLPYAIFSKPGTRDFHVTSGDQNGSFLKPSAGFLGRFIGAEEFRVERVATLPVIDLDSALAKHGIGDVDHVKIDTEGCEAEILAGAARTLAKAVSLEVEVWFNTIHERAPLFGELDRQIRAMGFVLFDVEQSSYFKRAGGDALTGPKGQLIAGDALYFRDFLADPGAAIWTREKLVRYLLVVMQYGYLDFAWEIASEAGKNALLQGADLGKVKDFITANRTHDPAKAFKNKQGLKAWLKRLFPMLARQKPLGNRR